MNFAQQVTFSPRDARALRPFMSDLGLTHIALPVADVEASAAG
jgi:hypothetical protein